ncbi:alpha/beta hydrolase-fold protein [Algoriphagus sp.]|uniref:alpha/beta hydrolase-fold protein n=1 Tax=Algoriphagus sp. TaxID=1872435 RepID=UPI002632E919|nr:alpha/beta hydrolase-fold protein [Algoriphagus sp.]
MKKSIFAILLILIGNYSVKSQEIEQILIGTKHSIESTRLNEDREYWVNLPDSYHLAESAHKTYPILILLDGHLHFRSITGIVNYMSADAYGSRTIPEMIVVGIRSRDRERDYTPDKIVTVRANNTGGGNRFLGFLEEELIPELDRTYRTAPYRILFGHSLGGLLATHAFMKEKTLFNAFIAVDPSFGTWDAGTMDKKLDSMTEQSFSRYIYLATANWGKRNLRNRDRHVRFYESLNNKSPSDLRAKWEYFEREDHNSVPITAFHNGISTLFEGYGLSFREVHNLAQLTEHFQAISEKLSYTFPPPESLVNQLGYSLLRSNDPDDLTKALEFFILNVTNYPNSPNSYDSLGEAFEAVGEKQKAIKNYKKSLDLNPKNEHAMTRIEKLTGID